MKSLIKKLSIDTSLYSTLKSAWLFWNSQLDRIITNLFFPSTKWIFIDRQKSKYLRSIGSKSQYFQDIVVFLIASILPCQSSQRFFVDIGCNHPIDINNTYLLERLGWDGISIDPQKSFTDAWKALRKTEFINCAISANRSSKKFCQIKAKEGWEHTLSGFKEFVRKEDLEIYGAIEYDVNTCPLSDLIKPISPIDAIFIDVEGAELVVLQGISLRVFKPSIVIIENNSAIDSSIKVRNLLAASGYSLLLRIGATDDVWLRKDLMYLDHVINRNITALVKGNIREIEKLLSSIPK